MSALKEQLTAIERYLLQAKADEEKLAKGTRSAAPKIRASLLEIGKTVSEGRKLALETGKAIVPKKRAPKESKSADEEMPAELPKLARQIAEVKVPEVSDTPSIRKPRGRAKKVVAEPAA
jgi:hypothetical protein